MHSIRSSEDSHITVALKLFLYHELRPGSIYFVSHSAGADIYCTWTIRYQLG